MKNMDSVLVVFIFYVLLEMLLVLDTLGIEQGRLDREESSKSFTVRYGHSLLCYDSCSQ